MFIVHGKKKELNAILPSFRQRVNVSTFILHTFLTTVQEHLNQLFSIRLQINSILRQLRMERVKTFLQTAFLCF